MSARDWTPAQKDAIEARRGTVLVSAAAGSGKTAVLVQRVIERLTDPENPSDADRLLVVTFTKAAAAEMRERISARLSELLAADPTNFHLQRQQILLDRANISTIHSFCSGLVRENFYKLNISPDFRISDDSEMALLRSDAVGQVMDEFYGQDDPAFSDLVESFSSDRNDDRLIRTINDLYDFVRSHPFPKKWLQEKAAMYRPGRNVAETEWGSGLLNFASGAVDYCISLTENALSSMEENEKILVAYHGAFSDDLANLLRMREEIREKHWDNIGPFAGSMAFSRLGTVRGYERDGLKLKLVACRDQVKYTVKKLAQLFCFSEEECIADIERIRPLVEKLFQLVTRFSDILDGLKTERRAADFGDLEHWAIRLLIRDTPEGPQRTEEALELSQRFDEVMVDEYQDTNEAQDMLFRAISRDESNLFMVGDVKQSIYSFRQAMPGIFLEHRSRFKPYRREIDNYPSYLVLDKNFRSRSTVTDSVNFIFSRLMSTEVGDIDYSGQELLVPAAVYSESPDMETRLEILDLSESEEEPEDPMEILESRHIASMIHQMIDSGFQVTEKNGQQRTAVFGDFCILLRSANNYAPEYVRELQKNGIPAWSDISGGFFASVEISVVLSLLRVVDNPDQDIPLAAVLMSPVYGFTPDDMSDIRRSKRRGSLYSALLVSARNGDQRISDFLKDIAFYRTLAATMPSDDLINIVYEKSEYFNMVQAMPGGTLRLSNLRLLLEYAKRYENSGYNGLSGFIRFIDRLQMQKNDLVGAVSASDSQDTVKVMSIHKSKGLEFPVCILAGCSRRFNKERGDALLHPSLGLGVKLKSGESMFRYTTMPREAIALEQEREGMSEELRILYVAMTRAREKLIFVTTLKNAEKALENLMPQITQDAKISSYAVRTAGSISDWLLMCALKHPDGTELRALADAGEEIVCSDFAGCWTISRNAPDASQSCAADEAESVADAPLDTALIERLEEKICYQYPYLSLRGIPAKVAASELAEREHRDEFIAVSRPAFLEKKGMTSAERGTALHAYLQFADYPHAKNDPDAELARLLKDGFLREEQGKAVEMERVRAFFASDLAGRILSSKNFQREFRFTAEIPASRIDPSLPQDLASQPVVLQGAVDCLFREKDGIVIVDYKTDRAGSASELSERYRPQLMLYRLALEEITGEPVKECILYSFYLNSEIPVK